ncbi:hypothetical protein T4E_378 [Trichinella pseudospiralis]|uniref:Secreted protein n=1 Tax=Trichinella pseudospiralis TaxID=6337 RepID=A0A0V0XVS8_TRIPS|nr:hypothetical protein T4E_378 [Trichinella pseudospiralis]
MVAVLFSLIIIIVVRPDAAVIRRPSRQLTIEGEREAKPSGQCKWRSKQWRTCSSKQKKLLTFGWL